MTEMIDVLERIRESLKFASARSRYYKRMNTATILITIVTSAFAAFFAASAAYKVSTVTPDQANPGQIIYLTPSDMKVYGLGYGTVCGLAAALSLLAVISAGVQKGFDFPTNLEKASGCLSTLKKLEFNASRKRQDPEYIEEEYEKIIGEYPEYVV